MAPVTRSFIRNVGSPAQVAWDGHSTPRIRSAKTASFAALSGGDTFSVTKDSGSPVVVTAAGGEASAADVAALINGTSGLSGVAFDVSGRLEVRGSTGIKITGSGSLYTKLGLANVERLAAAAQTTIFAPSDFAPDDADLTELLSNTIAVPAGANMFTLLTGVTGDAGLSVDVSVRLGTSAIPAGGTWSSLLKGVGASLLDTPVPDPDGAPITRQRSRLGMFPCSSGFGTDIFWTPWDFNLGAHITEVRIAVMRAVDETTGDPAHDPPTIQAYVAFGVR